MVVVSPKWYKIDARELEDGRWQLHYEEGFDPKFYDALKLSTDAMRAEGVEVELESDRVTLDITGPKNEILNMLAGEFFGVSELGQMTIAELYRMLLIRGSGHSEERT